MRRLLSLALVPVALAACSTLVTVAGTGTTGSGGASSVTSSSRGATASGSGGAAASGSAGAAGFGGSVAASGGSAGAATGGSGGGGVPCDPSTAYVLVEGDGPPMDWDAGTVDAGDASCGLSAWAAGGEGASELALSACTNDGSDRLSIVTEYPLPGSNPAQFDYLRGGADWTGNGVVAVTTNTCPGLGLDEPSLFGGWFHATVMPPPGSDAGAPISLTGTFCVPGTCSSFICASPDTPIATPGGDRSIADLAPGDLVYSVDRDAIVAVPVLRATRTAVKGHRVVRVTLDDGAILEISPGHPTADGRTFGDLRAGGLLDGHAIASVEVVPYRHAFTYDILPGSSTGFYFAGGALIGSTLSPRR